jgi:hypothetical protein
MCSWIFICRPTSRSRWTKLERWSEPVVTSGTRPDGSRTPGSTDADVAHYQRFFNFTEAQDPVGSRSLGGFITLTDDDVDDIVAYLKLLGPNR